MTGLYNIAVMLVTMVPCLAFLAASVLFLLRDHPVFAGCTLLLSFLTIPKIETGPRVGNNKENKDEATDTGD